MPLPDFETLTRITSETLDIPKESLIELLGTLTDDATTYYRLSLFLTMVERGMPLNEVVSLDWDAEMIYLSRELAGMEV